MKKIIILLSFIFLLGGCADYKEVNEMAIVSAIGIDYKENEYAITLEVLNEKIDKNSSKVTTYTRTAKANDIAEAIEKAADLLSLRAYYQHVKLVIISKEIAENHLANITDFFIRSTYLRENFYIVLSNEISPEEILKTCTEENPIASSAIISLLQSNGYASNYAINKRFYVLLQDILDFGKDGAISNINVDKKDFYIDGLAIFNEFKMISLLDNEMAVTYNLLKNEIKKPVFSLTYEGHPFSISIYDIKSDIAVEPNKIKVKGIYRAKIMNNTPNFNIKDDKVLEKINEDFSKLINEKIENFIKTTQKYNTDVVSLANNYYIKTRDKNNKLWQHAEIESDIKVVINKKGLVYSIYENN